MVALLLSSGADQEAFELSNATPLILALDGNHLDCVRLCLDHIRAEGLQATTNDQRTVLHYAAALPTSEALDLLWTHHVGGRTVQRLLETYDSVARTPLAVAVVCGSCANVIRLLELGASTEAQDESQNNLLHLAAKFNATACMIQLLPKVSL